jgi:hypothetical protein
LRNELEAQRDEASEALDFEAAARVHKRLQKLDECWRGISDLCALLNQLDGVAVTAGSHEGEVRLWPVHSSRLHQAVTLTLDGLGGHAIAERITQNLSQRSLEAEETAGEALAILTKWAASSWCDGEWVKFEYAAKPPLRKIANAARRVHARRWGNGETQEEGAVPDEAKLLPADDR